MDFRATSSQAFLDAFDRTQTVRPRNLLNSVKRLKAYRRALLDPSPAANEGFDRWIKTLQRDKLPSLPLRSAIATDDLSDHFYFEETLPVVPECKPQDELPPLPLQAAIGRDELSDDAFEEATPFVPECKPRKDESSPPPLEHLRHHFQIHCPVLYAQVLEPTLADIRKDYSAALAEGLPVKAARRILLRGYVALAAGVASQLGYSLFDRVVALWRTSKTQ